MRPIIRLLPLALLLGCVQPAGPQPVLLDRFAGPDEILVSWPEGSTISRVNQLARTICAVEGRQAVAMRTVNTDGLRGRIYRCQDRPHLTPGRWPVSGVP